MDTFAVGQENKPKRSWRTGVPGERSARKKKNGTIDIAGFKINEKLSPYPTDTSFDHIEIGIERMLNAVREI